MKTILLLLVTFITLHSEAQCWDKISEPQDTTAMSFAISTDGSLWGWGVGLLGNGNPSNENSPVLISSATNWESIYNSWDIHFAIKTDSTLWGWGSNSYGEMANGSTSFQLTPFPIGSSKWISISVDYGQACGVKKDGTLWIWGRDWPNPDITTMIQFGGASDWKKVKRSYNHFVGIKQNGTLWSWGVNYSGQLGLGNNTNTSVPTQIGSSSDWEDISIEEGLTYALKSNGTLWACGENGYGQLGDGTTIDKNSLIQVAAGSLWERISTSSFGESVVGIKTDGTLWGWGRNIYGNLGFGNTVSVSTPVQVGSDTDWKDVGANGVYTIGLKTNGSLYSWGENYAGQLGNGTYVNQLVPGLVGQACIAGLQEYASESNLIKLFPNPTNTTIHIEFDERLLGNSYKIYDQSGRVMIGNFISNTNYSIDLSQYESGIYLLNVEEQVIKIVKE